MKPILGLLIMSLFVLMPLIAIKSNEARDELALNLALLINESLLTLLAEKQDS